MPLFHHTAILGLGTGELLVIMAVLVLITVLIALALSAVVGLAARVRNPGQPQPGAAPVREQKKCPDCAEFILAEARVCKHCGYRFEPAENSGEGTRTARDLK